MLTNNVPTLSLAFLVSWLVKPEISAKKAEIVTLKCCYFVREKIINVIKGFHVYSWAVPMSVGCKNNM
jgi:hypothetical protein